MAHNAAAHLAILNGALARLGLPLLPPACFTCTAALCPGRPGSIQRPWRSSQYLVFCVAIVYGRDGRSTTLFGGFLARAGQEVLGEGGAEPTDLVDDEELELQSALGKAERTAVIFQRP